MVRLCDFGTSFSAPDDDDEEEDGGDGPAAPFLPYLGPEFICNDRVSEARCFRAVTAVRRVKPHGQSRSLLWRCLSQAWCVGMLKYRPSKAGSGTR